MFVSSSREVWGSPSCLSGVDLGLHRERTPGAPFEPKRSAHHAHANAQPNSNAHSDPDAYSFAEPAPDAPVGSIVGRPARKLHLAGHGI